MAWARIVWPKQSQRNVPKELVPRSWVWCRQVNPNEQGIAMSTALEDTNDVRAFWNSRAGLGQWAGTRDVTAKQLEIEAIADYVRDGMRVLDFGCGNGITAIELARRFDVEVTGVDFAEQMVVAAAELAQGQELKGRVRFQVGNVE